jgi:hypothetical protein
MNYCKSLIFDLHYDEIVMKGKGKDGIYEQRCVKRFKTI